MKKIFGEIDGMVLDMESGMTMAYPGKIAFDPRSRFFTRQDRNPDKVVLISGWRWQRP